MVDKTQSDSEQDNHVEDGAHASGEDAIAVGKDGLNIKGEVGGDVLGPGSSKIQITTVKEPTYLPIIVAIITFFGIVLAAFIGYLGNRYIIDKPIQEQETKNAESKATMEVADIFKTQTISAENRTIPANVTEITLLKTPTIIPTTPSPPTPTKILGLEEGCINQNTWTPFEGEAHSIDISGCWNLKDWGFRPDKNEISLKLFAPSEEIFHGIYRTISPYSKISFDMNVHKMSTVDDLEPKLMFGILPSSLRSQDLGKYLSYQRESAAQTDLFIKLNDGTITRGSYLPSI
jgi:hypothetical protein